MAQVIANEQYSESNADSQGHVPQYLDVVYRVNRIIDSLVLINT